MGSSRARRLGPTLGLLVLLVAPALPWASGGRVLAHAQLVASSPGAGAIVPESPDEIRLVFSEPLEEQVSSLDVVDVNGEPLLEGVGDVDPADPYALVVADPALPDGVYLLQWRSLSAADGHTAEGFFNFGVGDVPGSLAGGPQGMTHTETDAPGVIGRWLTYVGLLLALGMAIFHRVVIRSGRMPQLLVGALGGALLVSAAASLGVGVLAGVEAGAVLDYLVGTRNGSLQLARAAVAAVGGIALLLVASRGDRVAGTGAPAGGSPTPSSSSSREAGPVTETSAARAAAKNARLTRGGLASVVPTALASLDAVATAGPAAGIVAATTGLVGIVLLVLAGHAAALPGVAPLIAAVVHVVAAAIWVGGIVGILALVRWPALVSEDGARPILRTLVPRFSALALVSIGLLGLTGVYSAWSQTGALISVETEYGRTLLMKAGFAVGALALGGLNYLDGGRMMNWLDGFRTRVTIEVMLAATVLALTAALAITPPLEEAGGVAIEPIPDAFGEIAPNMSMAVSPGRPGVNRIVVTTNDALAGTSTLALNMDELESGTTTRVPLALEGMTGMDHPGEGMGMRHQTDDGAIDWTGDAIVLPPGSQWDTSVLILDPDGNELGRQRFAFALDDRGINQGQVTSLLDPAIAVAAVLLLGGGIAVGLGLGGWRMPRCEALASRVSLIAGGGMAAVLGALIGMSRLTG